MIKTLKLFSGASLALIASVAFSDGTPPGDVVIESLMVGQPLTSTAGDPAEGRKTFANKKLGNCLACHANEDMSDQLFHGEIGPALNGVASRWSPEQMRAILVNAKAVFTDLSIMPAFYSLDVGADVREDLIGKTILTAQQVEDLVAYLSTLK